MGVGRGPGAVLEAARGARSARRRFARATNARPSSKTLVNSIPERSSASGVTEPTTLSSMTGISRATSRPRASRSRAAAEAVPGADPVLAVRHGAACASARAWRRDTGTDSALTLQLPSFTGRFCRRGRSKKYPGKISRVHADGTFDVSCNDAVSFEAPSIRRLLPASRGRAPLRFCDGLTTQTTTAGARLGSRRALSRRSAAGAATPIAGRQTNYEKATPSRRDTEAGRSIIRARSTGTGATGPTTLAMTMASARRAWKNA